MTVVQTCALPILIVPPVPTEIYTLSDTLSLHDALPILITTGATIDACSRALRGAGAASVRAVAIAAVRPR